MIQNKAMSGLLGPNFNHFGTFVGPWLDVEPDVAFALAGVAAVAGSSITGGFGGSSATAKKD